MSDERSNTLGYWIDRWTPENPSETLPRMGGANNNVLSTFYIGDASYLRMKNIEIGYTLPRELLEKMRVNGIRVFVSGKNLLTLTKLDDFDPDRAAGNSKARNEPIYKAMTAGFNVNYDRTSAEWRKKVEIR